MSIQPKKDIYGLYYYEELPNNAIVASIDHFYRDNKPILGKPYLVYSFIDATYQAYRVGQSFPPENFNVLISDKRVYVFTKNQ